MYKEIPVVHNPSSSLHKPQFEYFNCQPRPHLDVPARSKVILKALEMSGIFDIQLSDIIDVMPFIKRVHNADYLKFLSETSASVSEKATLNGNPSEAIYPSVHQYIDYGKATNPISRRGFFVFDTYTPIMKDTNQVSIDSAGVALSGAKLLKQGEELVYALSRPSGHHTEKAKTGGMCYINNIAVAAQYLLDNDTKKIAIFDIDFHHGNGTQNIFYDRPDALVVNINADPKYKFPHFTGYADEFGEGDGVGANFNFPLSEGASDSRYDNAVVKALDIITRYQPEYLLISAGFDTHEKEQKDGFKISTSYYRKLGKRIHGLELPTLVIQEGGYNTNVLGDNVVSFLKGLSGK